MTSREKRIEALAAFYSEHYGETPFGPKDRETLTRVDNRIKVRIVSVPQTLLLSKGRYHDAS